MNEPLVIVDAQGTEHEFPGDIDPKQAAMIVRNRTAPTGFALPGPAATASGDPEADALARFAGQHPTAATALAAGTQGLGLAAGAATMLPAALATSAGRLLTSPAMKAAGLSAAGEYLGRKVGGTPGAIIGATLGGGAGLRGLAGVLRSGAPATASRPAADALAAMGRRLVLSPADAARKAQLMTLAEQEAQQSGMVAAGRQARGGSLVDQLFGH